MFPASPAQHRIGRCARTPVASHAVAAGAASTILAYLYPDDAELFTDMANMWMHAIDALFTGARSS